MSVKDEVKKIEGRAEIIDEEPNVGEVENEKEECSG